MRSQSMLPVSYCHHNYYRLVNEVIAYCYQSLNVIKNMRFKSDSNVKTSRLLPKILRFNLTIPAKFQNDIILTATNKDFGTNKHVDFCNIQVSISSTFYVRIFRMNFVLAAFSSCM